MTKQKPKTLIHLQKIKKSYFSAEGVETAVLHGIDLKINQGEFVSIMGPSGAGKSTLLHILGFLDRQTGGTYLFDNKKAEDYTEIERAIVRNQKMGFIFQAFNLLARTSVLENVKLPLVYSDIPQKKWNDLALKAIESVGLAHRIHHDPAQLSGGEKQRTAIARSLVCDPPLVFADEPTGNLDTKSGETVMKILQRLHQEGQSIILITHEKKTARHAERLIHILDGLIDKDEPIKDRILNFNGDMK